MASEEIIREVYKVLEERRDNPIDSYTSKIMQKKSEITEDDLKNEENEIQKLTDKKVEEIDNMLANKEKEIMSI